MQRIQSAHNSRRPVLLCAFLLGAAFALVAPSAFAQAAQPVSGADAPATPVSPKSTAANAPYGYSDEDSPAAVPSQQPQPPPPVAAEIRPQVGGDAAIAAPAAPATVAAGASAMQLWAENDLGWSDRYYSSGIKIAYTTPEIFTKDGPPLFLRDLLKISPLATSTALAPASYRLHFSLAHEIYTPWDEFSVVPQRHDHPYAALLYGTLALSSETSTRLDSVELSAGVIGPSALGRQGQNSWHRLIGANQVRGWKHQLRDEPILQLAWTRAGRYTWLRRGSFQIDWHPRVHVEAGTVRDYAAVGSQWRLGWGTDGLPRDFGVANLFASPAFTRPAGNLTRLTPSGIVPDSAWLYLDFQAEAWLWNSVLDGNLWHKSASVHRNPWVGEVAVGLAAQWGGIRLNIAEILRTREFRTQDTEQSVHTTISLSFLF